MSFYALSALINGCTSGILGLFIFTQNYRDSRYLTFILFCFSVSVWSWFYFVWQTTTDANIALISCRGLMGAAIFIPIFFLHHLFVFFDIYQRKNKLILYGYIGGLIFFVSDFTHYFVKDVTPKLSFKFWPNPGLLFHPFLILWIGFVLYGVFIVISEYIKSRSFTRNQLKYVLFATIIGWAGGATNYPLWYNIPILPVGNILVSGYIIILTYAIVKHRLLDINLVLTRTGIFLFVYTLILGIPFIVAIRFKSLLIQLFNRAFWIVPMGLMAVLATICPFIYIYLEKKAEEKLLAEQRRYQNILKQAAIGMTRVRNLKRLIDLITHIMTKTVHINYCGIYLLSTDKEEYILKSSRNNKGKINIFQKLSHHNPLVVWLKSFHEPLIYEEIKRKASMANEHYIAIEENMRLITSSVIIPSFLEKKLIGFLVLGEKQSGQIYTVEDLNVFQVLASQAAMAIENAQFYEEAKEMHEQIAQAEKMATIGTMADGISHQLNNRFHALSLISGNTLDTLKQIDSTTYSIHLQRMFGHLTYSLERIQSNVLQGGEIVSGLLKYSRKQNSGLEIIELSAILDNALAMLKYKAKLSEIDFERFFPETLPKIKGSMVQLQEVLFNCIDNSYESITEKQQSLKELNYRGKISVMAELKKKQTDPWEYLIITVQDNGMGIKEEHKKKIFTPFFTTKTSSRRGTGLGLYVIKRIVTDTHKGRMSFESVYSAGSKFIIELPIY